MPKKNNASSIDDTDLFFSADLIINKYLEILNIKSSEKISHSDTRKIFVSCVHDFSLKKIDLDTLSSIAEKLAGNIGFIEKAATDLGYILDLTIDQGCPFCYSIESTEKILKYFNKHKGLSLSFN